MAEGIPPLHWDLASLKKVDAFGADKSGSESAKKSTLNLKEPVHSFFRKEQWVQSEKHPQGISEARYNALQHSFHIASKLLALSNARAYMGTIVHVKNSTKLYSTWGRPCIVDDGSWDDYDNERQFEAKIARMVKYVFWVENSEMWSDLKRRYSGLTVVGHPYSGEFRGQPVEEIARWDKKFKEENSACRQLTVAIPSQFIDAIMFHEEGTRAWTRAVFFAAYTMVHEIGHVVFWADFKGVNNEGLAGGQEPLYNLDLESELGNSLMASIFGGWLIQPMSMNDGHLPPLEKTAHSNMIGFKQCGFYWVKQPRVTDVDVDKKLEKLPEARTCYSMPFEDIQKFTQSQFWNLHQLTPSLPFLPDNHCRRTELRNGGEITSEETYFDPFWIRISKGKLFDQQLSREKAEEEAFKKYGPKPPHVDKNFPGASWALRPHNTMPADKWRRNDLIRTGAMDDKFRHVSDLKPLKLHKFFRREAWPKISNERYNALLPSFSFATRLIELSTEYYTTFLPFSDDIGDLDKNGYVESYDFVSPKENPTQEDMDKAKSSLLDIAENTVWLEDSLMYEDKGQFGVTRMGVPGDDHPETFPSKDRKYQALGKKTRPLVIKITTAFANAILAASKGSARQLTATLCCAITLVHELGHVIHYADFRQSCCTTDNLEPYIGDDAQKELGISEIGWIFGGWDLGLADTGDDYAEKRFEVHMFWRKVDKCTAPRLYWTTHYSVPLSYLKKLFTQKCWDEAEKGASSLTSELERLRYIRRQLLHPTIPFDTTKHSRRLKDMVGEDEWIDQDFQGGTPFADGLPYHKHDGGRKFNAQNPKTYPYIDPYWGDRNDKGKTLAVEDDGRASSKPMRFGVELEMTFAFNLKLLVGIQQKFARENPDESIPIRKRVANLAYEDRNKPPFNVWADELPFRAYKSFALANEDGGWIPYSYEIPFMLATCLQEDPNINFEIKCYDEAKEAYKNDRRYKTWTVVPDESVRGVGSHNVPSWLPHIFNGELEGIMVPDSYGMEVVSRVLNTGEAESFEELKAICTALTEPVYIQGNSSKPFLHGAFVTNSTALHVHVEAPEIKELRNLAYLVIIFEDEIARLHPLCQQKEHFTSQNSIETNREHFLRKRGLLPLQDVYKTIFSNTVRRAGGRIGLSSTEDIIQIVNPGHVGRHRIVNFKYANRHGDTKTVEFRAHRGTLDYEEIKWWIEFVTRFVYLASRKDKETLKKLEFSDWSDPKINIFYLLKLMEFPDDGIAFYKGKMARYMDYPLKGELNAWHLELPPGSTEPGFGPPYKGGRKQGNTWDTRHSGPGGNDDDDGDQRGFGSSGVAVANPQLRSSGDRKRDRDDDEEDRPASKRMNLGPTQERPAVSRIYDYDNMEGPEDFEEEYPTDDSEDFDEEDDDMDDPQDLVWELQDVDDDEEDY